MISPTAAVYLQRNGGPLRSTARARAVLMVLAGAVCACGNAAPVYGQAVETTLAYNPVGTRTSAANQITRSAPTALAFHPSAGSPDSRVLVFGDHFPVNNGVEVQVQFGGMAALVVNIAPNVLEVEVPAEADTGSLVVEFVEGDVRDRFELGTFWVEGLRISPPSAWMSFGDTLQFEAEIVGLEDQAIEWDLAAFSNADGKDDLPQNPGTISSAGLYQPPPVTDLSAAPVAIVRAVSVDRSHLVATAVVRLFGAVTDGPPVTMLVPGAGDPSGLGVNLVRAHERIVLSLSAPGDVDGLERNSSGAFPPVKLLLPAEGSVGTLEQNTVVARPPVTVEFEPE